MEKNKSLKCTVETYDITLEPYRTRISFHASSKFAGKEYEGQLHDDTLSPGLKINYGNCEVIYSLLEVAVAEGGVILSDSGELKFTFSINMGKMPIKKEIVVPMSEMAVRHKEDQLQQRVERVVKQLFEAKQKQSTESAVRVQQLKREIDETKQASVREAEMFNKELKQLKDVVERLRKELNEKQGNDGLKEDVWRFRQSLQKETTDMRKEQNTFKNELIASKQRSEQYHRELLEQDERRRLQLAVCKNDIEFLKARKQPSSYPNPAPAVIQRIKYQLFKSPATLSYLNIVGQTLTVSQRKQIVSIFEGSLTLQKTHSYFPVFLTKTPIIGIQSFEIHISQPGNKDILIGVNTLSNRNGINTYRQKGSMYLFALGQPAHWIDGHSGNDLFKYVGRAGDRVQVLVDLLAYTVEWKLLSPIKGSIGKVPIPLSMRNKDLYPALEFSTTYTGTINLV